MKCLTFKPTFIHAHMSCLRISVSFSVLTESDFSFCGKSETSSTDSSLKWTALPKTAAWCQLLNIHINLVLTIQLQLHCFWSLPVLGQWLTKSISCLIGHVFVNHCQSDCQFIIWKAFFIALLLLQFLCLKKHFFSFAACIVPQLWPQSLNVTLAWTS